MSFQDIELKPEYRSKLDNVVSDFYDPVLKQSVLYKRAVGFFSSSALISLSAGICGLVDNGGTIQVIASPRLSQEDIEAINDGIRHRDDVIKEALLRELTEPKGRFEEARLNLLSNLIAAGRLEIRIAFLEDDNTIGMFHEKLGLMYDQAGNIIAFSGSMNESANAFTTNYEAIDVFASWTQDVERVYIKQSAFNAMWNDYEPSIKVMKFPEIDEEILHRYRVTDKVETNFDMIPHNEETQPDSEYAEQSETCGPQIPEYVHMRSYQLEAIEEWVRNEYSGIFDMATGTGKTYTALAAITRLFIEKQSRLAVIIICPYQHLVEQWKEDIVAFGMKPIVCYSESSQKNWRERLKNAVTSFNLGIQNHFCVVSTNATFATEFVQGLVSKLCENAVIVVDEAHNFGAENLSNALLPNIPYRLALSATIDRHGDPDGTRKIYEYFGDKCIEYTLKDAIDNDMLTPYYYHPVQITLNQQELDEYLDLTAIIRRNSHTDSNGKVVLSDFAKRMLIKRARLVAGASEKLKVLQSIMTEFKNDNQILVYCGATTLHDIDYREGQPPIDEARQIDLVADMLGNELGMRISKFTSEEDAEERERIKADFADGKHLQALVAIRCLDEGVNIPSIRTAFILASSTNPKEYVQRRGRVLRKFPGKSHAVIYDFITLPVDINQVDQYDSSIIESVKGLAVREITRMKDFASIAENPYDSDLMISEIQHSYNIESEYLEGDEEYD